MKKKIKKKSSDSQKVKPVVKKLNPFEVHINRKKYDILGMKSKSEKGLPGVSRAKSLKKRKGTLLQEYKLKDKKNMFLDRRIGERNRAMTAEDKILARYTAERMRFHHKKSIFNLGDDEELTHKGQTLTEIEKFDNPRSDDEDDEEEQDGKLDSDFVGEAHFGGGIFKKVEGESKSRKDLIDQLIAESIKRKAEKQKLKQQTLDLTEKLDTEWKELLPIVTGFKKTKTDVNETVNDKKDDKFASYDIMSRKLKFEARGKPSDRLKSEEEIAKEEKEKLEQLEKDRIQRMKGETEGKAIKHRSADDLDDGFDLGNETETFLTYKNGELNIEGEEAGGESNASEAEGEDEEENSSSEEEEEEEEAAAEAEEDDDEEKMNVDVDETVDNETPKAPDDSENSESDSDNLSDLKDSDDEGEDKAPEKTPEISTPQKITEKNDNFITKSDETTEQDALEKAKAMEAARNELPYTFEIPKEYEEFEKLLKNYNPDFQGVIIERMIKCHHPRLNSNSKGDLDLLFTFMLQHLQDSASDDSLKDNCFKILDRLAPWFYDLTQWNPQNSSDSVAEVIREKHEDFMKSPKSYPSLDTLVFLKLVSILFPTSDYRHPAVTPTLIFMQQILFQCNVRSSIDLSRGLFITTLILEYCALSKRFVPEAISFLRGVLRLVHPNDSKLPVLPPFNLNGKDSCKLFRSDKTKNIKPGKLTVKDLIYENSSDEFKINATNLALKLLSQFCDFWSEDQPAVLLFNPFISLLEPSVFDESIKKTLEEVIEKINNFKKKSLKMLMLEKKKPMPLRLYEPNIEKVYGLKKYQPMGKKKAEQAKLLHKYKREMKGALREIRRDRSFIAKLKYKETVKSDMERQRKVREILSSTAEQAGELNKLQRKKKK